MGPPSTRNIEQSVNLTYAVTNNYEYYSQAPASTSRGSDSTWLVMIVGLIGLLVMDRFYAKHEYLFDMASLVSAGLGIGMLIPTLWTLYTRPWLRRKAAWILVGWLTTLYLLGDFLFKRLPAAYYAQLQSLRNAHHVVWTHIHEEILIGYRLMGWSFTLVDIGVLITASVGLFVIAYRRTGPVSRFLWNLTEPGTGGLVVAIVSAIAYGLVSGLAFSLFSHQ